MQKFKENSARHFQQTLELLRDLLSEEDGGSAPPDVEQWHRCMSAEMPKTKYSKALERILKVAPSRYLACEYKDAAAAFPDGADALLREDLAKQVSDMDEETRSAFWQCVAELNRTACICAEHSPQRPPTRDEIQENIKKHRQTREAPAPRSQSMAQALAGALAELADMLTKVDKEGARALRSHVTQTNPQQLTDAWVGMLNESPEFEAACRAADAAALTAAGWGALPPASRDVIKAGMADPELAKALCTGLDKINGLCRVQEHIPKNMMSQIEKYAMRLADDINQGKCDLASMDLQQIGQDVLANCDSMDAGALAENVHQLIPSLQSLSNLSRQ